MTIAIYHNPACGTSRNVLAMIREEPVVVEYLKTPPTRERLKKLIAAMGIPVRGLLREKGTPYAELGLGDPKWTDDQLLDFMMAHPILINRPIVVTPREGQALSSIRDSARHPAKPRHRQVCQRRRGGRRFANRPSIIVPAWRALRADSAISQSTPSCTCSWRPRLGGRCESAIVAEVHLCKGHGLLGAGNTSATPCRGSGLRRPT